MKGRILVIGAMLLFSVSALGQETKPSGNSRQNQPSQPETTTVQPAVVSGSTGSGAAVQAAIQERVKELIKLVNTEPNLLMINPRAQVVKGPDWKPVTPDGKYNQDFKVAPDDSAPEISQAVNIEQNRQKWAQELVRYGTDAVPELVKAVLDPANKYRTYLIYALGQIKDVHAAPAILKYYWDAVEKEKVAKSLEAMGAKDDAAKMRQETDLDQKTSIEALKSLSGQDFGDNYPKWEAWWKEMEKKIGKVELPKLYEATGAKSKEIAPSQPANPPAQSQSPSGKP